MKKFVNGWLDTGLLWFSAVLIPVWLMVMWTVGSVLVLVWQWFVNFRFEKKLYEERENSNPGINTCADDCHDYI